MAVGSLTIASTSRAQLGWTREQCEAKYGKSIKDAGEDECQSDALSRLREYADSGDIEFFEVSGFRLGISFINDSVAAIAYEPKDLLTSKEAMQILKKNCNIMWQPLKNEMSYVLFIEKPHKHHLWAYWYGYKHRIISVLVLMPR
jgi:hypothetical protein